MPLTLRPVNHFNYPDDKGRVYCRADKKLKKMPPKKCYGCPLYTGSIQGEGVECTYNDLVDDNIIVPGITDPKEQLIKIAGYLDQKLIPEDPLEKVSGD